VSRSEVGLAHNIDEVAEGNEVTEKRGQLEGNPQQAAKSQTQRWQPLLPHLVRVNAAASRSGQTRFTALLHHVDVAALGRAFKRQRRAASPGVDRMTVDEYEQNLEENLQRLHARVHSGQYWPKPVLRAYIPKPDGGKRGLGLPALEDKIVQSAVAEVLNAIYEVDFYGFSYGFRPGRSPHGALASLDKALMTQRVNWVLDLDIQTFFDSLDHEWLVRMLEHRIADRRITRLIRRWLKAGVLESGEWRAVETGSPQGSGISPLLANVFLHYSFDAWIQQWRQRHARGQIVVVRYADDVIVGAQYESDARRLLDALGERLAKFGLALNEDKTRLIEFGRIAARRRAEAGLRRPGTFNFLGFTHYGGTTRSGKFIVKRKTQAKRMARKLKELRTEMRRRWHSPVPEQHTWLRLLIG
jgi:group II intron reverse transcriptase/maturase